MNSHKLNLSIYLPVLPKAFRDMFTEKVIMYVFGYIALVYYCASSLTYGWSLPPTKFINEFINSHDRLSITIYLPTNSSAKWVKWHRNSFSKYVNMQITIYYKIPAIFLLYEM